MPVRVKENERRRSLPVKMWQVLHLLIPALIPSWRFFDGIAPSPRIEFAWRTSPTDNSDTWQEFRPRPRSLSPSRMIARLFWNPRWNENLFLVSCAERLMEAPTDHSRKEILNRIKSEHSAPSQAPFLQFRLIFVHRTGDELARNVTYTSGIHLVGTGTA